MDVSAYQQIEKLAKATSTAQIVVWQDGQGCLDIELDATPVDVFAIQKGLVSLLFGIAEKHHGIILKKQFIFYTSIP